MFLKFSRDKAKTDWTLRLRISKRTTLFSLSFNNSNTWSLWREMRKIWNSCSSFSWKSWPSKLSASSTNFTIFTLKIRQKNSSVTSLTSTSRYKKKTHFLSTFPKTIFPFFSEIKLLKRTFLTYSTLTAYLILIIVNSNEKLSKLRSDLPMSSQICQKKKLVTTLD